ncbi:sensor histidine kinase [Ignavigranum ruoffiae]|uniref:sensor histidine kinase n=1 Tax=Ignavigranum ruoffiae TaxID=89093 RepID=UPI0020456943|nr:sensor histidine kinase [Ignavigranum ruoffiae]UPQ85379.1 sensor histidine kinase [Ignavigranum ruoffiae]
MNLRLWFHIFLTQLVFMVSILCVCIGLAIYAFDCFTLTEFLAFKVFDLNVFGLMLAALIAISAIYSFLLSIQLMTPYEELRAKINWLALGKYHHAIFNRPTDRHSWYEPYDSLQEEILELRDKMLQYSKDLQELSAAPIFVGEETREEIVEHERHRIARELHDSVSQQLFAATMMISAVHEQLGQDDSNTMLSQISLIEEVIGNAQTEMRALLLHLRPVELSNKSLKEGIEQLLVELQTKVPLEIHWELDNVRLETGIEDHLFRICQEAISNTLRHAKAQSMEVYLSQNLDAVHLKIRDDGQGFDPEASHQHGRYGLMNIKERVTNMGGTLKIISRKQQGTVIDISVPNSSKESQSGGSR